MGKSSQRRLNEAISENMRHSRLNTRFWRKVNNAVKEVRAEYDKNFKFKG